MCTYACEKRGRESEEERAHNLFIYIYPAHVVLAVIIISCWQRTRTHRYICHTNGIYRILSLLKVCMNASM